MTTWLIRCFAFLLLMLPFVPAVADDPDDTEIARLVKQLGSSDYRTRQAATKRLEEIGKPALDALGKATDSLEMRRRTEQIVARIEDKVYGPELCLTGHTGVVWNLCVSADGKRVLTGGADKRLRLWDANTGQCLRVFEGHTDRISGVALSPDGKRALSGGGDTTVRLWDTTTGQEIRQLTGHTKEVQSVAFGAAGQALSSGCDHTLRLWDLNTGKNTSVFTGHTGSVYPIASRDKGRFVATGSHDQSIRLWDLHTGKEIRQLTGHSGDGGMGVCFSPDGQHLFSCSYTDNTVRVWDVEAGKELQRIDVPNALSTRCSPDGKRLVTGGYTDNTVRIWSVETGKEMRIYKGHTAGVTCVAYFPDGKRIASASHDGTVRIWRAPR